MLRKRVIELRREPRLAEKALHANVTFGVSRRQHLDDGLTHRWSIEQQAISTSVRLPRSAAAHRDALTLIGLPADPIVPVRYWLDDIDEIVVNRGSSSAHRYNRALALTLPIDTCPPRTRASSAGTVG